MFGQFLYIIYLFNLFIFLVIYKDGSFETLNIKKTIKKNFKIINISTNDVDKFETLGTLGMTTMIC